MGIFLHVTSDESEEILQSIKSSNYNYCIVVKEHG